MEDDDRQVGHLISRREALVWMGATAAALAGASGITQRGSVKAAQAATDAISGGSTPLATTVPSCIVRPQKTQGPFYVDEELNRSDIRSDPATGIVKTGVLLSLNFNVSKIATTGCTAYEGIVVDVWHCDGLGLYSDETSANTKGQKFLRGYQVTDANGRASFTTIYPGWYSGRSIHIHFKIRNQASTSVFTSQLFFDDKLTNLVYLNQPYSTRGTRDTLNSQDAYYSNRLLLLVTKAATQGLTTTFNIGVQEL
ncbi:MAG: twin-arginine translocation pathway signal protein [Herpetosiphonaceae bacterium]|nr:twin-arginine translocation pathway signal protein [Herpetosiphonaceae bacterium]